MSNRAAITLTALALAAGLAAPAWAAPTIIDFDVPPALSLPSYSLAGVTFTSGAPGTVTLLTGANSSGNLLGNYVENDADPGNGVMDELHAVFDSVVGFVSVDLGDYPSTFYGESDDETLFLNAFDINNLFIVGAAIGITQFQPSYLTLSVTGAGIKSVTFGSYAGYGGSSVYADNFTFNGAAVPEPSAWALMIGGFGMMGRVLRRRRTLAAWYTAATRTLRAA